MKNYVEDGDRVRVTLAAAAQSGDVDVIGTGMIGVALADGAIGQIIDYATEGVFLLPKVAGAVIGQLQQVLFDVSVGSVDDDQAVAAAGDFLCGYAWEAAGNGAVVVPVKINRPPPAVT